MTSTSSHDVIEARQGAIRQQAEYEKRTAITGTANDSGSLTYVERLFADSDGASISAPRMPAVGPGRHSFPIVGSTVTLRGRRSLRGTTQTPAGGITIVNSDPESIRAAFTIANVDELVMPGIGAYLQSDIRAHLMSGLDNEGNHRRGDRPLRHGDRGYGDDHTVQDVRKVRPAVSGRRRGKDGPTMFGCWSARPRTLTAAPTAKLVRLRASATSEHFFNLIPHDRFRGSPHFAAPVSDDQFGHRLQDGTAARHQGHRRSGVAAG